MKILGLLFLITSCSTITINADRIDLSRHPIKEICIKRNSKVLVSDFLDVVRNELRARKIRPRVYSSRKRPKKCIYTMEYTARRKWDLKPFMTMARIQILEEGMELGSASFDQVNGLGFSKFDSTAVKLKPLFVKLFGQRIK